MRKLLIAGITLAVFAAIGVRWHGDTAIAGVFTGQIITSAGPLDEIFVANDLGCQVAHTADASYEFYPTGDQQGNCGTFVLVGATVYGLYGSWGNNEFTPVSQSAVTGAGTSGSPYQVVTVADAGATGIRVTQTDSYVVGDEFYRTDIQVANTGNTQAAVKIYRAADCYLGGSDSGYGYLNTTSGEVGCTQNPNNIPTGRVELWTPITTPDFSQEDDYSTVRSVVEAGGDFNDACICATLDDNGAGLQWNRTINAGANVTVAHLTTFSPTGAGIPTPTPGGPTSTPESETPGPPKTHTPTATVTAAPTDTAVPATETPVPAVTVVPTSPGGGAGGGGITPPDTGSGPGAGPSNGSSVRLWLIAAAAAVMASGGALLVGRGRTRG